MHTAAININFARFEPSNHRRKHKNTSTMNSAKTQYPCKYQATLILLSYFLLFLLILAKHYTISSSWPLPFPNEKNAHSINEYIFIPLSLPYVSLFSTPAKTPLRLFFVTIPTIPKKKTSIYQ